jgi:type I restriction enzyme S subunit
LDGVMDAAAMDENDGAKDGPWALPDGWCWTTVGLVAGLRKEKVSPQAQPELPFVGMDDIERDGTSIVQTRCFGSMKSAGNRFYTGDVLYGRLRPYLNKTAVTTGDGVSSGELLAIRPSTAVDCRYLQLFMHARRFVNTAMGTVSGDRPRIDFATIAQFDFPLPPLAEQRRIVARIDALLAEIAEGEAALAAARKGLDTFRRALLKAAVTGELTKDWRAANPVAETGHHLLAQIAKDRAARASGKSRRSRNDVSQTLKTSGLPAVPAGWTWATLDALSWASSYGTSVKCAPDASGVAVLRIPNIREGEIIHRDLKFATTELGLESPDFAAPGDLLVIRTNGSEALIGRGGVCFAKPDQSTYFASYLIRFRLLGGEPMWRWISKFFESPAVRQWMTRQIASSAGQYNVSQSNLASLLVPIPPASEIVEILRRVSDALSAAADTEALLDAEAADAARLKQSILKAAFEGRLVPQDPADEPATALLARLAAHAPAPARRGRSRTARA